MRTIILLSLLITAPAFAENRKLIEAFDLLGQVQINSAQAGLVTKIQQNLVEANKYSDKAEQELKACLEREADLKEEKKE